MKLLCKEEQEWSSIMTDALLILCIAYCFFLIALTIGFKFTNNFISIIFLWTGLNFNQFFESSRIKEIRIRNRKINKRKVKVLQFKIKKSMLVYKIFKQLQCLWKAFYKALKWFL